LFARTAAYAAAPLVHFVGRNLDNPRVKTTLQTIVIASAGLLLAAVISLARDALTDWTYGYHRQAYSRLAAYHRNRHCGSYSARRLRRWWPLWRG
jgi:hypothetical protein